MRTSEEAIAEVQLRIIQNIGGICGGSEAIVSTQLHFAAIRL